ncbi:MAG: DUF3341 domain-containing protein [Bacteroides sp.]|nr:MAG: DUF3341 domain-containing protein [Bacteroides sp.]
MYKKYIIALFDDEIYLLNNLENLVKNKILIDNVYTPYPIHKIEKILNLKKTKLPFFAFIGGSLGLILGFNMMFYMTNNWPMNIGGKPYVPFLSFIPICFEMTILLSAYSIGIMFILSILYKKDSDIINTRITNDQFAIVIDVSNHNIDNIYMLKNILKSNGSIDINEKIYDKK